ncbi:MAG: hypothetical protein II135_00475 [Clostridia bacterium]|nr:hypothetical protein [Clostridia bacterium]
MLSLSAFAEESISLDAITEKYKEAENVFRWFEYGFNEHDFIGSDPVFKDREYHECRPWETNDSISAYFDTEAEFRYELVEIEELNTKEKMKAFLMTVFSASAADEILSKKCRYDDVDYFVEKDGYLYVPDPAFITAAGDNRYGGYHDKELKLIEEKEGSITVRMTFTPLDGNSDFKECDYRITYDYILIKQNGIWVFENFITMRDLYLQSIVMPPDTSDSAVYITAAAGVIALCCAVICKKKIKT